MQPVRRLAVAILLGLVLPVSTLLAAEATLSITSVGGKSVTNGQVNGALSGAVTAEGKASLSDGTGTQPVIAPLVADAGDSPFVQPGDPATLIGTGFGGSEPYGFAWTSTAGPITGTDAATAQLDTTGLAPGIYDARLTVTDSRGDTATDNVKIAVGAVTQQTLLDQTRAVTVPGVVAAGPAGTEQFAFQVAAGTRTLTGTIEWPGVQNDFDLSLVGPDGTSYDGEGDFVADGIETAVVERPQAGNWTLVAKKFLVTTDTLHAKVIAELATDPRPQVDAGGPYTFLIGATQSLDGTVSGGTSPVAVGWDTNLDGKIDKTGPDVTLGLAAGRHLVTLRATDANGLERRQTTSVLVASAQRLAYDTTAVTVVSINDTGINPYHMEFTAEAYPDPDVLALTDNFTRHPSEYIPGYPADAEAIPITLGQGYFPAQDTLIWNGNETIKPSRLYWIPGTKIIGAVDAGGSTGANAATDGHPILDDDGHGDGSASVAVGNRYGYCPTCLLVVVEGLDETVAAKYPWIDIQSNSWGYQYGIPGWAVNGTGYDSRTATERGQTVLFAAGNGIGNAFDVTQVTYVSDRTGGDWNVVVGAIRRDNNRAIVGDGTTVHISAWGDGNLPSACRTGTVGQCAHGGTSAATPYTAGVFGRVLTEIRRAIGDGQAGQRPGQVVASGIPIAASAALADGKLTRTELREAVLKTAYPLNQANSPSIYPYPATAPYADQLNVLLEGYGAATPDSAQRAIDVLLGRAQMPDRSYEDQFFALDRQVRDTIWGGFDRNGDGTKDSYAVAGLELDPSQIAEPTGAMYALRRAWSATNQSTQQTLGANAQTFWLHRAVATEGDGSRGTGCDPEINELYMDQQDTNGDLDPCYDARVTTTLAGYRPIGIWPTRTDINEPLPSGSTVAVTLYVAQEVPTVARPTGVLMAGDREIGRGDGTPGPVLGSGPGPGSNAQGNELPDSGGCVALGELCWTRFEFSFTTTRHAFTGEHLTFQAQLLGGSRAYAFGYEGAHASKIAITAADMPSTGLTFGVTIDDPQPNAQVGSPVTAGGRVTFPNMGSDPTGAGDHPTTRRVDVSIDDPSFASPIEANLDSSSGTWSAPLTLANGNHTIYARATINGTTRSSVVSRTFRVGPTATVEWQVVKQNRAVDNSAWRAANGFSAWSFGFNTSTYGKGAQTIVVRIVRDGYVVAQKTVKATFN